MICSIFRASTVLWLRYRGSGSGISGVVGTWVTSASVISFPSFLFVAPPFLVRLHPRLILWPDAIQSKFQNKYFKCCTQYRNLCRGAMLIVHAHIEHQRKRFIVFDKAMNAIPPFADLFAATFEIFNGAVEFGKRLLIVAGIESAALVGGTHSIASWHAVVVIVSSAELCKINSGIGLE